MAIDRWFIGGGAEHTPESARRLVYASTGGAEGVGGVNDLKVMPLAVPGAGVRVVVGSGLIKSRYVGGETQTYMGTVYEQETVSIAATGSGGARSDLIVLRVEDPFAAGSPWPTPSPVETAPYVHVRVISGVPAGTTRLQNVPGYTNDTALTLARIDMPVSTGTVTSAMITDLRNIAQPRRFEVVEYVPVTTPNNLTSSTVVTWPATASFSVQVPEWATHALIDAEVAAYRVATGACSGRLYASLIMSGYEARSGGTYYNEQVAGDTRQSFSAGGRVAIPEGMRGQAVTARTCGLRNGGAGFLVATGDMTTNRYRITFIEDV